MLLRGIAWAAKAPIDALVNGTAPVRGGGGRRGGRAGAAGATPAAGGRAGRSQ
jgi:hypothetical protein